MRYLSALIVGLVPALGQDTPNSPMMGNTTVVAAATTSANVLIGEALAFLTGRWMAMVEASTSAAAGEMTATFKSGLTVHADGVSVNPASAAGVINGDGRDVLLQGEIVSGQLDLKFASTAAGNTNATWRVTVTA